MRFLLDTQALIVLARQGLEALSQNVRPLLADTENDLLLSAVTITEIAIKNRLGKLDLTQEQLAGLLTDMRVTLLPYTAAHASALFTLPQHHKDPFDRMLVATALVEGVPLIASDMQMRRYAGLTVIW